MGPYLGPVQRYFQTYNTWNINWFSNYNCKYITQYASISKATFILYFLFCPVSMHKCITN